MNTTAKGNKFEDKIYRIGIEESDYCRELWFDFRGQ